MVLDVVAFIPNEDIPLGVPDRLSVLLEDVIIYDTNIRVSPRSILDLDALSVHEPFLHLSLPVDLEGCGADDQDLAEVEEIDEPDGLDGLAQSHLISDQAFGVLSSIRYPGDLKWHVVEPVGSGNGKLGGSGMGSVYRFRSLLSDFRCVRPPAHFPISLR